tara:strand:- start:2300 stop:3223 length:924 start_codon:yes stop_codon:yes gene_type:complete
MSFLKHLANSLVFKFVWIFFVLNAFTLLRFLSKKCLPSYGKSNVSLEELFNSDDEVFDHFASVAEELISELKKSKYPQSAMSLIGLMGTINSLKLAAFDLAEETDTHLYAIKTMLRPAIEHFLRFSYLHMELVEHKNDAAGLEYRKYCAISETIALIKSQFALEADRDIQTRVLKKLRQIDGFEISNRQLEQIVAKWSYKNIARKLDRQLNKDKEGLNFIRQLVSTYSELSSFVHGGINAEVYYHSAFASETLDKEVKREVSLFSFLAATARSHMLMLGCHLNPKFQTPYNEYSKKMVRLLGSMDDA